jgi:integrase family protein with SAM-like domain
MPTQEPIETGGRRKLCKANVGTRKTPRSCGKPVVDGMLACCKDHSTSLVPTTTAGVYYRGGVYVAVWRHRGKQHKSFHRTLGEAREAKADHSGSAKPSPQIKAPFDEYARAWVKSCQGRTRRGFDGDTRAAYERALELYAIPHFRSTPLRDVDRDSVNALIAKLQRRGLSAASIAKYIAPVRALFSDAVENG